MFMHKAALVLTLTALAAGCGGGSDEAVDPEAIEGTWTYELTRQYMLDNGISEQQAKNESGRHTAVLRDGNFSDSWRTAEGVTGSCSGKYVVEGSTVTFYWKRRVLRRLEDEPDPGGRPADLEQHRGVGAAQHRGRPEGQPGLQQRGLDARRIELNRSSGSGPSWGLTPRLSGG